MTEDQKATLTRLAMILETGQAANGIDHARQEIYAEALRALLSASIADTAGASLTDAARDVIGERMRQMTEEGHSTQFDDTYEDGQMALAAGNYALACAYPHERDLGRGRIPPYWPWADSWWKPTTKRRNLVKAGALILAEIERLDRAAAIAKESGND